MGLDYNAIGTRIKERRVKKKLTQEMRASAIGISCPHMSNIERGKTKVSLGTLVDIANVLETTLDELLCDSLVKSRAVFDQEISQELESCSEEDIRIVYDLVRALVASLNKRKNNYQRRGSTYDKNRNM